MTQICGNTEMLGDGTPFVLHPARNFGVWRVGSLPGISDTEFDGWMRIGFDVIESICDVRFFRAPTLRDAQLRINTAVLEGRALANQQIPYPGIDPSAVLVQTWNTRAQWRSGIYPPGVAIHETLHFLGYLHESPNPPKGIMEPTHHPDMREPAPHEQDRMRIDFGQVVTPPPPPPPPPPPGEATIAFPGGGRLIVPRGWIT